jgi:hypothetical protein
MKTFATLIFSLLIVNCYAQFVPRPAISFYLSGKSADNLKNVTRADTLIEVKAFLQGEQKKKMPNIEFLIQEVEISLMRNDRQIASLVFPQGKGNFAALTKIAASGDKYIMTARKIQYIENNLVKDVGIGNVVRNYVLQ